MQVPYAPIWGVPPPRHPSHIPLLNELGANIQSLRRERGFTQEQLAELIEVRRRAEGVWPLFVSFRSATSPMIQAAQATPAAPQLPREPAGGGRRARGV